MEGKSHRDQGDYFPRIGGKEPGGPSGPRSVSRGRRFTNFDEAHKSISERAATNPFLRGESEPLTTGAIELQDFSRAPEGETEKSVDVMDSPGADETKERHNRVYGSGIPSEHVGSPSTAQNTVRSPANGNVPEKAESSTFMLFDDGRWVPVMNPDRVSLPSLPATRRGSLSDVADGAEFH